MEHLTTLIATYSVFILFPLMIIEGPIMTVIAAFLASLGMINVVLVYVLAVLGNVIGDLIYYIIGRYGRKRFVTKYGHYVGVKETELDALDAHYKEHLFKTIAFAKMTEAPVVPTLIAAGIARTDFKKFLLVSIGVEIPKVLLIVLMGYFFGKFYQTIESYFKDFVLAGGVVFSLFILLLFIRHKLKPKST